VTVYFFAFLYIYLTVIILFFNVKLNKNAIYLAGLMFAYSIFGIMHNLMFDGDSPFLLAIFRGNSMPLIYLIGPLLYFYVRGTVKDNFRFYKTDYLHFLPAIFAFICVLPYIFTSFDYKLEIAKIIIERPSDSNLDKEFWIFPQYKHFFIRPVITSIYAIYCLFLTFQFYKQPDQNKVPNSQRRIVVRWLFILTILTSFIFIFYIPLSLYLFKNVSFGSNNIVFEWLDHIVGYSFCVIPLVVLVSPQILYGVPTLKTREHTLIGRDPLEISSDIFEEDPFYKVSKKIIEHLKTQKPFLDPEFNMEMLSEQIHVPKHHLYYCFGNIIKVKFATIRNRLRVEHAKSLLMEGKSQNIKLEGIGFESGFNSRSHFFATFKEETGMTPSEFLERKGI